MLVSGIFYGKHLFSGCVNGSPPEEKTIPLAAVCFDCIRTAKIPITIRPGAETLEAPVMVLGNFYRKRGSTMLHLFPRCTEDRYFPASDEVSIVDVCLKCIIDYRTLGYP